MKVNILAIETSCDETAAAVMQAETNRKQPSFKLLSSVVRSQIKLHAKTGGVVPEAAARAHMQAIQPVVVQALEKSGLSLSKMTHIAVTNGPGLVVALIVGVEFAKGLALATDKPIVPVNHMCGHLYSAVAAGQKVEYPALALIVSGGHTMLVLMKDEQHYRIIGETKDDAAGEAFDKVARLLSLPYPGGPEISRLALKGKHDYNLPRPMIHEKNYDFSFSGLKTAVLQLTEKLGSMTEQNKADVAMSFEQAAVDVLVHKTLKAAEKFKAKTITLSGGVAANKRLRSSLTAAAEAAGIPCLVPEFSWCTDNASMIAMAAYIQLRGGKKLPDLKKVSADPGLQL